MELSAHASANYGVCFGRAGGDGGNGVDRVAQKKPQAAGAGTGCGLASRFDLDLIIALGAVD